MPQPYKIFIIYAREDAAYLKELRGQLRPLELAGRIQVWSDKEINPGQDWEQEIVHNLDTADIILILISAAYYDSAYIHDKEIKYAIKRHDRGEAKVLPIIVRPCSFIDDPVISRLQLLPTDGKPVTDRRHWQDRDDAWLDVVKGLKQTLDVMATDEKNKERKVQEAIDLKKKQEAWERQEQIRLEQEEKRRKSAQILWNLAVETHTLAAYQTYLDQFPDGLMAHQARAAIKTLKQEATATSPVKRYVTFGSGALLLLLAIWGLPKLVSSGNKAAENRTEAPQAKFGLEMVQVPGGTFTMGSPVSQKDRDSDECQHVVSVKPFSIGKYEVTQADWQAFMGYNPSQHQNCDECPVEQVSWDDIQEFLKKLNARYPGKHYRLPTEAEWEYAARGGSGGESFIFAGSDNLNDVGWFANNSNTQTHPVGNKQPNQLGLYDMSGNVWEWCQDMYAPYPCDKNPKKQDGSHVLRGGSAFYLAWNCEVAERNNYIPESRSNDFGFRLASDSLQ